MSSSGPDVPIRNLQKVRKSGAPAEIATAMPATNSHPDHLRSMQFNLFRSEEDVAGTMSTATRSSADQLKPARRLRTMSRT
jgi:hypothetical protein